jgi:hypothetical protein
MHRIVALGLAALCTSAAATALEAQSTDLAARASAAFRGLNGVRYEASYRRSLVVENRTWLAEGSVVLARARADERPRVRIEARLTLPGQKAAIERALVCDGRRWCLFDRPAHTYMSSDSAAGLGEQGEILLGLVLADLVESEAFAGWSERAPSSPTTFAGEPCETLVTRATARGAEATWWLGAADLLPRRVDRRSELAGAETQVERLTLTGLVRDPSFLRDPFEIVLPEGWTRVEPPPRSAPAPETLLLPELASLEALRVRFEAARARVRVVCLFAPT